MIILRKLNGVFPVYKPKCVTSSQYLEKIKSILSEDTGKSVKVSRIKLGHSGTLDNTASGILVVGINNGCSKLPCFLEGDKTYKTVGEFGTATDTYNDSGAVTQEKPYEHITEELLKNILSRFRGQILQTPPVYSALKLNGRRYSDLVKEGVEVELKPRPVLCHRLTLESFSLPRFGLELTCGKGFYVRSLVHDIGIHLNSCAHLVELERTQQGPFSVSDCLRENEISLSAIAGSIDEFKDRVDSYCKKSFQVYRQRKKEWAYRE